MSRGSWEVKGKMKWMVETTVDLMQAKLESAEVTSRDLVSWYIDRIFNLDWKGPELRSVLELNPDIERAADERDAERREGSVRGPLHGIPVLLKDNIDTYDRMHTSAGSLALAESFAAEDAFLVKRLRESGAILLGKANMTEWANFMTDNMPSGYSSRGGQTLNPYGPGKFFVGGSSSGSAAAVAANLTALAVGTETSGSILSPVKQNSIVGIKPTVGLISRSGIIPISHSQDTAGPMARTVRDAAILLGAMSGVDERDPATLASEGKAFRDYTPFLEASGLQGARIGVPREYYRRLEKAELRLMENAINAVRQAGAVVIDPVMLPSAGEDWEDFNVLLYEFKHDLNGYLSRLGPLVPVHSLSELITYNRSQAERMLKFGQTLLEKADRTGGTLKEEQYLESRKRDLELSQKQGIDFALHEYGLDALLFPGERGSDIAARAGYPSVAVPAGYTEQGPFGVAFCAGAFSEPQLLRFAYAYEQTSRLRVPPALAQ